jgi:hypothetical protein
VPIFIGRGAPVYDFARCSAISPPSTIATPPNLCAFVQEYGFAIQPKLWIAEFGLPAPARIRAALD